MEKLLGIMLDKLKNESFSLLLSLVACACLVFWNIEFKRETELKIQGLQTSILECQKEKFEISLRLTALEAVAAQTSFRSPAPARMRR